MKSISDYTGLNFNQVLDLPYSQFKLYKKDSFIYNMGKSEKGKEFLRDLYILFQDKADLRAVREKIGGDNNE